MCAGKARKSRDRSPGNTRPHTHTRARPPPHPYTTTNPQTEAHYPCHIPAGPGIVFFDFPGRAYHLWM